MPKLSQINKYYSLLSLVGEVESVSDPDSFLGSSPFSPLPVRLPPEGERWSVA